MSTRNFLLAMILSATVCVSAVAQKTSSYSAFVTGTGYVETPPFYPVAPGQITTFFIAGLPASGLNNVVAAVMIQGTAQSATVLSAKPMSDGTAAITVQIPFTVVPGMVPSLSPLRSSYSIQFGENDNPAGGPCVENTCTPAIPMVAVFTNPHIITTCDIFYSDAYANASSVCQQAVTHQNGQLVTTSAPATPGEVVTLWALGLGAPLGGIPPNVTGPIAMNDITLQANFTSTLPVVILVPDPGLGSTPYEFAGLPSPAFGLYQINFAIPQPPVGTPSCVAFTSGFVSGGNLSLSVGRNPGSTPIFGSGSFVFFTIGVGPGQSICVAV